MAPPPSVHVFFNPKSGPIRVQCREEIARLFAAHACPCRITQLTGHIDIASILRQSPSTIAVAAGGDGTVNAVVNAAALTGNPIGVLPVGTLNHFARDLRLPLTLPEAVRAIATGDCFLVDAAELSAPGLAPRLFVNNSSLGAYPAMVIDRERLRRTGWNKQLSLLWASARAFVRFRILHVDLTVHGRVRHCATPFLFVGNNEYRMAGLQTGSREDLTNARLLVYLAPGANRLAILRLTLAALLGRAHTIPEFEEFCVDDLSIHLHHRRIRVALDGEVLRVRGPLHYRIRPALLKVMHPAEPHPEPQ